MNLAGQRVCAIRYHKVSKKTQGQSERNDTWVLIRSKESAESSERVIVSVLEHKELIIMQQIIVLSIK